MLKNAIRHAALTTDDISFLKTLNNNQFSYLKGLAVGSVGVKDCVFGFKYELYVVRGINILDN